MKFSVVFLSFFISLILVFSCRKDTPIPAADEKTKDNVTVVPVDTTETVDTTKTHHVGEAIFSFDAMVGTEALFFDTVWYRNSGNEYFTVSKFNYYLSNIKLKRADGSYFNEKESYHLISHRQKKNSFKIKGIPEGTYTSMEFVIGVDSLRNVSGAQTGDLDVVNDMFWDWNTGYIFYKLEGSYVDGSTPDPEYSIHIGGFEGPYNCLQKVLLSFPAELKVGDHTSSKVLSETLVEEIFGSPRQITISQYFNELSNGPKIFQDLSVNYRDMIKVKQVIN